MSYIFYLLALNMFLGLSVISMCISLFQQQMEVKALKLAAKASGLTIQEVEMDNVEIFSRDEKFWQAFKTGALSN